ncbi:MAG: acyl-CoA thioesterase [Nevskiaceae bacterium]|jgi:acyl-CoA thioester hydrolase|nr:acyl-CoA thioesterase [Nevskiaceae bacterium]
MIKHLEHEIELEPAFYDIDPMEVVWHGHYVKFLERARGALFGRLNFGYLQMKESGYAFPIIELFIRYAQPLRLGQRVRVLARIVEWESRLRVNYEIRDAASGRRLTRAHTVQVAVDMRSGNMCYLCPKILWERIGVPPP